MLPNDDNGLSCVQRALTEAHSYSADPDGVLCVSMRHGKSSKRFAARDTAGGDDDEDHSSTLKFDSNDIGFDRLAFDHGEIVIESVVSDQHPVGGGVLAVT